MSSAFNKAQYYYYYYNLTTQETNQKAQRFESSEDQAADTRSVLYEDASLTQDRHTPSTRDTPDGTHP